MEKVTFNQFSTNEQRVNHLFEAVNNLLDLQIPQFLKDGTTIILDVKKGCNAFVTLKGNRTLNFTNLNEKGGDNGIIKVYQDGTGGRTLAVPAGSVVSNDGAGALTLSSGANKCDVVAWYYDEKLVLNFNVVPDLT